MSKIIEELAEQYVKDIYNGDTDFIDETESVLTWLFSKPLAQRLTEAEKIRMRNIYKELTECIENSIFDVKYLKGKRTQLILIFGKDLFKNDDHD